jgi:hypothetical protein
MATTPNIGLDLPVDTANIDTEIYRLLSNLQLLDTTIGTLQALAAGKAPLIHSHELADVTGLVAALNNKMAATKTFALSDLTDTRNIAGAPAGYILVKQEDGKIEPVSAPSVFGTFLLRIDSAQTLTEAQKSQVIANIFSGLTTAQKSQALANIGATPGWNEIINGDFRVAQGGVGPFNAAGYTFDQWAISGANVYLSREGGNPRFQVRLSRSVAALGTTTLYQKLEAHRANGLKPDGNNPGGVVTITFDCAAAGAPSDLTVSLITTDGDTNFNNPVVRGTFTVPVSGNTDFNGRKELVVVLPTGIAQQGAYVSFSADTSNAASWAIRDVEMCAGPSAKTFRPRNPEVERGLCERFFYKGRVSHGTYFAAANSSSLIARPLPAVMRATPSVNVVQQVGSTNLLTNTLTVLDEGCLHFRINNNAVGYGEGVLEFTASARLG